MEKKITGYTTVDISQWHRKEHFEAFQSVAQCTYNQTVQDLQGGGGKPRCVSKSLMLHCTR